MVGNAAILNQQTVRLDRIPDSTQEERFERFPDPGMRLDLFPDSAGAAGGGQHQNRLLNNDYEQVTSNSLNIQSHAGNLYFANLKSSRVLRSNQERFAYNL